VFSLKISLIVLTFVQTIAMHKYARTLKKSKLIKADIFEHFISSLLRYVDSVNIARTEQPIVLQMLLTLQRS